jgi:hypothetical protein
MSAVTKSHIQKYAVQICNASSADRGLSYGIVGLNNEVTIYGIVCLMLKN